MRKNVGKEGRQGGENTGNETGGVAEELVQKNIKKTNILKVGNQTDARRRRWRRR